MNRFLFEQECCFERLALVRIILCAVISILMLFGPYDSFYVDTAPWLYHAKPPFKWFPCLGAYFVALKAAVFLLAVSVGLNIKRAVSGPLFALLFLFLNYYVTCFGTTYFLTNTHLNFFAIALCFEPTSVGATIRQKERCSFILAFMITYVAALYIQAGVSKLLLGGWEWFAEGKRIWTETLLLGTPFGKWLTKWPWVFQLMSAGTAVFELVLPFLFFSRRAAPWIAVVAILFHLSTFVVMGISFWFLWMFYFALFLYPWCFSKGARAIYNE